MDGEKDSARRDGVLTRRGDCAGIVAAHKVRVGFRGEVHGDESTRRLPAMKYYVRMSCAFALSAAGVVASCSSDESGAGDTLPPIVTTTTTTTLPPTTTTIPETYVIQKGDSLFAIAEMFGLSFAELAAYNGITNPDDIQAGQKLRIPQPGETTTSTVAVAAVEPSTTLVSS